MDRRSPPTGSMLADARGPRSRMARVEGPHRMALRRELPAHSCAALVPGLPPRLRSVAPARADQLHTSVGRPDAHCIGLGAEALSRPAPELRC